MTTYDWIVVGNGIVGSTVSYELAKVGFSVLLLEQTPYPDNATRYSYGGIAYWSGTTALLRQLCQEGIDRQRVLSAELEGDTLFRELDLILTIDRDRDPTQVAEAYADCMIPPTILSPEAAQELEPLLNRDGIAGALRFPHGHVSPEASVQAHNQAFLRLGGTMECAKVTGLNINQSRISGVTTSSAQFASDQVVLCTGGMTRSLLQQFGLSTRVYFTRAELIETPPVSTRLRTIVMPAHPERFELETKAGTAEVDFLWDQPGHEVVPAALDAGGIQLQDSRLRLGQISRTLTDLQAQIDPQASETSIRRAIGHILPALQDIPGQWYGCVVSFSGDQLPIIGAFAHIEGLHLCSGFSSPFAILPPLAQRFARHVSGQPDAIIAQFSPHRFATSP